MTGVPVTMILNGHRVLCAESNFLCVHKSLRQKRLAPLLVKELNRRVNLCDVWQAIHTSGTTLPTPVTGCTYWHRLLNPKKLNEIKFSYKSDKMSMEDYVELH